MCNRYNIAVEEAELAVLLGAKASTTATWEMDVYPRYAAPVIREEAGERIVDVMHSRRLSPLWCWIKMAEAGSS